MMRMNNSHFLLTRKQRRSKITAFQRKTARERIEEQRRLEQEALKADKFKQRLVKVPIAVKPLSLLHGLNIFYCGYCGKPVALFSTRQIGGQERMPPIYYGCNDRCQPSGIQRTVYVDRLIMELIQKRVKSVFPKPGSSGNFDELYQKFEEIEVLQQKRLQLLEKMHYASYKRDIIIAELNDVEAELERLEKVVEGYLVNQSDDNPFLLTIFETPTEKLNELDLAYRRLLVKMVIWRLRYFADFIVVSLQPLTQEEAQQRSDKGLISYINLRYSERTRIESISPE